MTQKVGDARNRLALSGKKKAGHRVVEHTTEQTADRKGFTKQTEGWTRRDSEWTRAVQGGSK